MSNGLSSKNISKVNSPIPPSSPILDTFVGDHLLFKHDRGKPLVRYSPSVEGKGSRYPITNHVTTQRLSEALKAFAHHLSSFHVPSDIHEALANPKRS